MKMTWKGFCPKPASTKPKTTKKPRQYFSFTPSLVYVKDTQCQKKGEGEGYFDFIEPKQITRPVGECTTNVLGSDVIFECDESKGVILEHVFHDVTTGKGTKGSCDGKLQYTMPISNGCNDYSWGAMKMTCEL